MTTINTEKLIPTPFQTLPGTTRPHIDTEMFCMHLKIICSSIIIIFLNFIKRYDYLKINFLFWVNLICQDFKQFVLQVLQKISMEHYKTLHKLDDSSARDAADHKQLVDHVIMVSVCMTCNFTSVTYILMLPTFQELWVSQNLV